MERTLSYRSMWSMLGFTKWFATLLSALIICGGCSKEHQGGPRVDVVPVTGKVLVDGKPAKGVVAYFLRVSERGVDFPVPEPVGVTDEQGMLSLSTYLSNDGGAPGEYKLIFEWPARVNPISGEQEGDELKGKYSSKEDSKITVTIPEGAGNKPHDLGTIELSTAKG